MFLKDLLANNHPLFTANLQQLERATGGAGIDTRLIADITQKAHAAMRALGLDPADTTTNELYQTLNAAVRNERAEFILAGTEFVLLNLGEGPVSFNLRDVVENAHHELHYAERTVAHAQRNLRTEIIRRYAENDRTHDQLVHQLAQEMGLKPEVDDGHADMRTTTESAPTMLAIGDIFTDAFIKLREDQARIDTDPDGSKRLSMPFGNKPPYDRVDIVQAVGPSPNAAVACARLGLQVSLMAWLGDDAPAQDSLNYLHGEHIDASLVTKQKDTKSNYYFALRYGADRTILVKNEEYDYTWKAPETVPDWVYLSLISESSWQLHVDLLAYLTEHPETKLVFQPGTFHFQWGAEKLAGIYKRTHLLVLNREEAAQVTGKSIESIADLAQALHDLGPEIVVITDGPDGSYASYDGKLLTVPNYPDPVPPFDRTGAGDAFASTIVAALALGESIETALTWAPINSMSVVQKLGAQAGLLRPDELQEWLQKAPASYHTEELKA